MAAPQRERVAQLALAALATLVLAAAIAVVMSGKLDGPGGEQRVVLASGRAYVLHVPPGGQRGADRPAMIVLHGLTSNPSDTAGATSFDALADRDGVLVAYPEGVRRSFAAGLCCGQAVVQGVDDVGFLAGVVADLRARGAGRVSVVGFSNGAMMAYRFGCARPDLVDTVGSLAGTLEVPRCEGPIRALHLHGALDDVVPYAGAYSTSLSAYLRPVPAIAPVAPGSQIVVREVPGLPHRWTEPGDAVDAAEQFWEFGRMSAPR